MESASTGPPPALFTLRSLPSLALAFGSRSGPHCPPTFGASAPPSQPARSHDHTPQRSPASTHPSTRSRPHACAHAHEHTPTHAPASHAYTFASRARTPARARAPALHTHSSTSEDSGICRRPDLRPMSYGSMEVLPVCAGQGVGRSGRSGEIWAGAGRGFRCWHSRISEKKLRKTVHFSLENFAKQIILRIFV